jgi:hypothetical protein
MALHCLLQEFQRRPAVAPLGDEGFQRLAFVIDSAPQIVNRRDSV